ncbi:hypothetical protein [Streptomyces sp. Da 82-17]|uniref:hypothetical protein n=1 Tax=Streptomyces sp. Da 82-17 TaxID=3377116 RepID=UPI0038D3D211
MTRAGDIEVHRSYMVDSDTEAPWFPMPLGERQASWRKDWAAQCAEAMQLMHGEKPKWRRSRQLRDRLVEFSSAFAAFPAHYAYLFSPTPGGPLQPGFSVVFASEGDRDETLRDSVRGNSRQLLEPFAPEPFTGALLGDGLRAVNRWQDASAGEVMSVRYAWRVPQAAVDVAFYVVGDDPQFMRAHLADFDAYARTLFLRDL